ncbi:MAG: glycosyltransferase family 8 protein [Verrucomicrobia bacterium]|nr:glycosyltransferase family 8 protein [Verrucomicrobiota bacterium]
MKHVAICSAANQTYVLGVAVALASAVLHAPRGVHCRVYLLDGGIQEASWRKLEQTLASLGRSCELIRLRPDLNYFEGLPKIYGSSVMTYARLMLPKMVNEDRILYVDADLLVQADWESLWEMALGEAVIAAATDVLTKTLAGERLDLQKFDLDGSAPYFQAGFFVMDLHKWRALEISGKTVAYLRENPEHCHYCDQSALNVVLYGRWKMLPSGWNTPGYWADQQIDGSTLCDPVLHFNGPLKPWNYGLHKSPSAKVFYSYLDRTAWKGWRPNGFRFACKMAKYRVVQGLNALRSLVRRG